MCLAIPGQIVEVVDEHNRLARVDAAHVAAQVVVLASDRLSGHVTGQVVTVAGGMEGRVIHE